MKREENNEDSALKQKEAEKKNERNHPMDMDRKITTAVNSVFYASYFIDLEDGSFTILKAADYARQLLKDCKTIQEACELFIRHLVIPEDQAKMSEFCKVDTIAKRLGKNTHIDCEYRGSFMTGWCQTSFLPVSYDENGNVTHVLFVLSTIDQDRAKNLEEGISSKENLDVLFDVIPSGIVVYEWDGKQLRFLNTNQRYRHLIFYNDLKKGDIPAYEPIHPDDIDGYLKAIQKALTQTHHLEYAFRIWNKNTKSYGWLQINAVAKPQKNNTSLVYAIFTDITDQKNLEKSIEELYEKYKYDSEHDSLTGLYNRNKIFAKSRELLNAHPDEQFVMLHCDIRHFHLYNTFFGEEEGDRLLCEIAELMRTMGWDYDYWAYGRIESDVFCAFFPIDPGHFEEHVRYFFREIKKFRNDFPLTPAIGAYWVTDRQMSMEEMFSYATIAAKSRKINLYGLISRYDEEMDQNLKETQQITSEMHTAIDEEQFEVYMQPKYSLRSEKIVGAEALVSWNHPKKGSISPGKFIPAFEKNGFIADLDRYMWEHVCRILRKWIDEGKPMYPVSVNISRVSMYNHLTVSFLKDLIIKYQLDPKYLELELTETAYMDDPEDLKKMLKELQEFGFKILMDDFGSGYSSLNTLRELPVDVLKLDIKFLSETQDDHRGLTVLSSVVRMSKLLNLPIVAEGVEKPEQADFLRSIGCEYVQGFLFGRPMPVAEYEKLLKKTEDEKKDTSLETTMHVADLLVDNNSVINSIQKAFPTALAMIEYENDKVKILRANNKFLIQFGLLDDYRPASCIIKEKMDSHSYEVMLESIKEAVKQKENIRFIVKWNGKKGVEKFICSVDYEETIDRTHFLMLAVMNLQQVKE